VPQTSSKFHLTSFIHPSRQKQLGQLTDLLLSSLLQSSAVNAHLVTNFLQTNKISSSLLVKSVRRRNRQQAKIRQSAWPVRTLRRSETTSKTVSVQRTPMSSKTTSQTRRDAPNSASKVFGLGPSMQPCQHAHPAPTRVRATMSWTYRSPVNVTRLQALSKLQTNACPQSTRTTLRVLSVPTLSRLPSRFHTVPSKLKPLTALGRRPQTRTRVEWCSITTLMPRSVALNSRMLKSASFLPTFVCSNCTTLTASSASFTKSKCVQWPVTWRTLTITKTRDSKMLSSPGSTMRT